jgi:hypothetical protein
MPVKYLASMTAAVFVSVAVKFKCELHIFSFFIKVSQYRLMHTLKPQFNLK